MATLLIRGGRLLPMTEGEADVDAPRDLWIDDGRIAAIGAAPANARADVTIEAAGCLVMPGLVQAHVHLAQTLHRGAAEGRTLLAWLAQVVWPLEAAHDEATLAAAARLGIAECLDSGSTTLLDMGTTHLHEVVLREIWNSGIRAVSGKAMMDWDLDRSAPVKLRETTNESLDESERLARLVEERYAPRVKYCYAPRFALSASPELHREAARRAREYGRWIHTHASETRGEVAAVVKQVGESCVRYLEREGVLDGRTTVAHAVHLEPGEVELLAQSRTGVAHCPGSNLKLGSGIADVAQLRQAHVNVGLGSDGAPCNNRLDLFREMSLAALLPRREGVLTHLSARDVVKMATLEGARAVGLEREIGSLEVGKRADVIVLDMGRYHTAASSDPYTTLVFSASPANVRDVLCDGRLVKRDFHLTEIDEREVSAKAAEMSIKLLERAGPR